VRLLRDERILDVGGGAFRDPRTETVSRLRGVSATVSLEPWGPGDLPLLERRLGDPRMTEHLGGPESPEKLRERQGR